MPFVIYMYMRTSLEMGTCTHTELEKNKIKVLPPHQLKFIIVLKKKTKKRKKKKTKKGKNNKTLNLTLLCFRPSKSAAVDDQIQEKLLGREETELVSCITGHINSRILKPHGH